MASETKSPPKLFPTEYLLLICLALYPLAPFAGELGSQVTNLLIFAILALGLNVVVGYTGLLHLGIAGFFGIGAYVTGVLTIQGYPFQTGFYVAAIISTLVAGLAGLLLGAPTMRLRGDYLALVTLGFGEVVRFSLRNWEEITGGTRGLNPVPPPTLPGLDATVFVSDYRPFYFLSLAVLAIVVWLLRNLERSRLGRAWVAIREDELAASCMGINVNRAKLAAFAVGSALAGLAGCLYATKLSTTASPDAYDFNRSIMMLCCIILGGLGSIRGTLIGVLLLVGFDSILAPALDRAIQDLNINPEGYAILTFSNWRLLLFGLALIVMMRIRPEGLLPSTRVKLEFHNAE